MTEFFQEGPQLENQYEGDDVLRSYLRWRLPANVVAEIDPELTRLGALAASEWLQLANAAEAAPPRHVPYDAWGKRVDEIAVSDAWRELDRISAREGIVATAYERRHGAFSRVHQMARLYLFHPSSALYSCPLAMADGAARFLELQGDKAGRTRDAFERLTTRDPARFWTAGQWMTERIGGSDVSGTQTIARREGDGFRLYGTKWFTSATTSQMAMTLARVEGAPAGGKGLSVFMVVLRDEAGTLHGIRVNRLKDKLGTRALPTAELTLDGAPALLVGGEGDGVRKIATILNVTRVYNAVCAIATMRRALALARDYATRRLAFGKRLIEHPLHAETLADLDARFRACFMLTFQVVELMGKEECSEASEAELSILRLLTPVAKLYTGKQAVHVVSECLEAIGGAGYIEDTGLPRLLRDAQVLPIWEGTTNVLSLDVLRAIDRHEALQPWLADARARMDCVRGSQLRDATDYVRTAADKIETYVRDVKGDDERQSGARRLAFAIARTAAAARLIEQARDPGDFDIARRWTSRDLAQFGA